MIPDPQTTKVYFTEDTPVEYPKEIAQLVKIIKDAGYKVGILEGTDDYFCRDYMPVQIRKDDFIQFVFRPDKYFDKKEYKYISNPVLVAIVNQLPTPRHSRIILDGGNVVKWNDKVIITDRVYKDNAHQFDSKEAIIKELEVTLQCPVIIIPEYPGEKTGYADGLIRFINADRVFINYTRGEPEADWLEEFLSVLKDNELKPIELPCPVEDNQEDAKGLYINYLHVGKLIVVPQFDDFNADNKKALNTIKGEFDSSYTVVPFEADWIAKYGGVFNCATWNIFV